MSTSLVSNKPDAVDDFLEHYGVKGMKWGKRKASSTIAEAMGLSKGKTPRDKQGNIKKPSYAREALLGTWSNSKKRYTDPAALKNRSRAGKLAGAAALSSIGSTGMSLIAMNTKNPSVATGALLAARMLSGAGSALTIGSVATGVAAVRQERVARANNG